MDNKNDITQNIVQLKTNKKPFGPIIIISAVFLFLVGLLIYAYIIKPSIEANMTSTRYMYDKLGIWSEKDSDKSGITAMTANIDKGIYTIQYNLFPLSDTTIDDEICSNMALGLIGAFTHKPVAKQLKVLVSTPYTDRYKNILWKPYIYFELNIDTLSKVNSSNFSEYDLLTIADNVIYYTK